VNDRASLSSDPPSGPAATEAGVVVGVSPTQIRVRLASGITGVMSVTSTNGSREPAPVLGDRGLFRVDHRREDGEIEIQLVSSASSAVPRSFDHDVNLLRQALQDHPVSTLVHEAPPSVPRMDEQRVQGWVQRVDTYLESLRKNRYKRLDEEASTPS